MTNLRGRRLLTDENGAAAVEFAMLAAPLLGMMLAVLQASTSLLLSQGLDTAVQEAGRMVMTGQAHSNGGVTSGVDFRDRYICNPPAPATRILPGFIDCSKLVVDIRKANDFASGASGMFDTKNPQACIGGAGDIVIIRAVYHSPIFAPFLALNGFVASGTVKGGQVMIDGKSRYAMMAATAFRNEPFGGAPPC